MADFPTGGSWEDEVGKVANLFGAFRARDDKGERPRAIPGMRSEASVSMAVGRPSDPMFYWKNRNLPYDIYKDGEINKVVEFARLLYNTHPVIGSAVDIYTFYPLAGMEAVCPKDPSIAEFYNSLFMDQLNYEDFLADVGREYWIAGEAFPFGSFNELLGVWDDDDLLLPQDVNVIRTPFAREPRFEIALPAQIAQIIRDRKPEWEYRQIVESYPELLTYARTSDLTGDERFQIPVNNLLMQHVKRTGDSFHPRGIPILMRAFRAVAQEEMLNAAQDSIATRLYTPLLMANLGASATDMGTNAPWVPTQEDLDAFIEDVNIALAADFRLIAHHFAVRISNVFGREAIPDMDRDFERLTERSLQAFGLSKTMISGAQGGETYAADALNRDLVSQLLTTYQRKIKRFFRKRAEVVAEAQGHYDFERKGGRVIPVMEEILVADPETGEQRVESRPKLLLPELRIRAMNLKDENQMRSFVEELRHSGVPISMRTRLVNIDIDLEDEQRAVMDEQVEQAIMAQEVRKQTYLALLQRGLPIPEDLRQDFEPHAIDATPPGSGAADDQVLDTLGITEPANTDALAPTIDELLGTDGQDAVTEMLPRNRVLEGTRPAESDEQRAGMPRASSLIHHLAELDPDDPELAEWEEGLESFESDDGQRQAVVGSWRLRHVGHRDPTFFYLHRNGSDPVEGGSAEH